jgi:hypothetical protein
MMYNATSLARSHTSDPDLPCRWPAGGRSTSRSLRPGSTARRRSRRPAAPRLLRCRHASRRHRPAHTPVLSSRGRTPTPSFCNVCSAVAQWTVQTQPRLKHLQHPLYGTLIQCLVTELFVAGGEVVPGDGLAGAASAGGGRARRQAGHVAAAAARAHAPGPHARGQGGRRRQGRPERQVWPSVQYMPYTLQRFACCRTNGELLLLRLH